MNPRIKKFIDYDLNDPKNGVMLDLSEEKLNYVDYKSVARIIEKTSFLKILKLPTPSKKNCKAIIVILNQATSQNTTLTNIEINLSSFLNKPSGIIQFNWKQIQSRMERNGKKIFAIHGGGNIGLGLMADIVSKSPFQYNIVATSNDTFYNNLINSTHKLWLQHGSSARSKTTCVTNVKMISREPHDIVKLYSEANILALCLTPGAFANTARDIAKGLLFRYRKDGTGLKVLILMNIPKCDQYVREKVHKALLELTQDTHETEKIVSTTEFIPTVVDRIVNKIPLEKVKNQLNKQLFSYMSKDFTASDESVSQQIDTIISMPDKLSEAIVKFDLQFNLLNAEQNFALYLPSSFPESLRFPAVKSVKNLEHLEVIKNKYINGPHAIIAWLGALNGLNTIAEAIKLPGMIQFIENMMEQEIAPALRVSYPEISKDELQFHKEMFFERCKQSIDDPVERVGRDPFRKLDRGGRIRGTIELSYNHKLKIPTPGLEHGIAAGILYAVKKRDTTNPGCKKILEIYERNGKSYKAILCYNGTYPSGNYSGLNPIQDKKLINNILNHISQLEQNYKNLNNIGSQSTAISLPMQFLSKPISRLTMHV